MLRNYLQQFFCTAIVFAITTLIITTLTASFIFPSVTAVGISTNEITKFDAFPGNIRTLLFEARPTASNVNFEIFTDGALTNIATLSKKLIMNSDHDKTFTVNIAIPSSIKELPVGEHFLYIGVREIPLNDNSGVSAFTSVKTPIIIRVLYPGKKAGLGVNVAPVNEGEPLTIDTHVDNWGYESLTKVNAHIDIQTVSGVVLKSFDTESVEVLSGKTYHFKPLIWNDANLPSGEYRAKGILSFDNITASAITTNITVGFLKIDIVNYTSEITQQGIQPIDVTVRSHWNSKIRDVSISAELDGEILRSPLIDIESAGTASLQLFWNTKNKQLGIHNGRFTVSYGGKSEQYDMSVMLKEFTAPEFQSPAEIEVGYFKIGIISAIILLFLIFFWKKKR